jgi:hypothetical protein
MHKIYLSVLISCLILALVTGCSQSLKTAIVVDEPSVRLEAELNLHYKTFSEVELTGKYLERWLYKYNYLPGAKEMTDEELFLAVDLNRTGLEKVKAAVEKGDFINARIFLVKYFKSRLDPCFLDPGTLSPSRERIILERANEFLQHPDFPDFPWPRDRFGTGTKDAWWNWVSHLYYAYRYTDEIKYLKGMMEMFSFWYETVRPPAGTPSIWLSPSFINNPWDSHQASRRVHTIALFNKLLKEVGFNEISIDKRIHIYKSIIEHSRFLISVNPGYRSGNIQICQMRYLLEAGIGFPEFSESGKWIDFAWENLMKHAWLDLMPDGGHYERATSYNNVVIRDWRQILELSRAAGIKAPDWLKPKLKEAQEWTMKVYSPILNLVPIGDSSMGEEDYALPYLIDGALLFPCPEFKYFVRNYPDKLKKRAQELFREQAPEVLVKLDAIEPKEPGFTSVLLDDTGWSVMRSGWNREALYMLFDYGSNEPWHCHRDGLGFNIFAYGKPLITDCGHAGGYQSDRSKTWYKETISHNLVTINGMSQRKVTNGTCDRWVSASSCDYVNAEHDGYKYLGAYCRRKITFVKPFYWIITDNITEKMCQTSGYHECEWLAHFQPADLTIDDKRKTVHTNNPDVNILLVPSRPENLKVIQSKGWTVTPAGEVNDAPYIGYAREGDLPIDYEVVAYPYKGANVPEIMVEQLDMGEEIKRCKGLEITTPQGIDYYLEALKGDYYFILEEKTEFHKYGEFSFDGEMALIREKDGRVNSILLVGGTCLKRHDLPLATCSGKIEWAEILYSDQTVLVNGSFSGRIVVTPL